MSTGKKVAIAIGAVILLCLCCCVGFFGFVSLAGYTQVNGICQSKGPFYSGKECPAVGQPIVSTPSNFNY